MQTADPASGESSEVTPRETSPIQVRRSSMSSSVSGRLGMVRGDTWSLETSKLASVTFEVRTFLANDSGHLHYLIPGGQSHRDALQWKRDKWTDQDDSRSGSLEC